MGLEARLEDLVAKVEALGEPRCHRCGDPAKEEVDRVGWLCAECCREPRALFGCSSCGLTVLILGDSRRSGVCRSCQNEELIHTIEIQQRAALEEAHGEGRLRFVDAAMGVLGCNPQQALELSTLLDREARDPPASTS